MVLIVSFFFEFDRVSRSLIDRAVCRLCLTVLGLTTKKFVCYRTDRFMKGKMFILSSLVVSLFFSFVFVSFSPIFAKPPFAPGKSTAKPTVIPTHTIAPTSRPPAAFPQTRLAGGLLKACQAHEEVIQTRLANLLRYANTMLETFDRISERVQTFYTDKVVPTGKTVSNYDALLADIQAKKTIVQDDLKITQDDANGFLCTGIDPKGHLTQFRTDMQEVKGSLKNYRTAIKDLIVAVRGVASEAASPSPTEGE